MTNDERIARIHERIDDLGDRFGNVETRLAGLAAGCEPCRKLVDRHEADLRGNGEGLRTRVSVAEARLDAIGDPSRRAKAAQRTSLAGLVTAIFAGIGAILSALLGR